MKKILLSVAVMLATLAPAAMAQKIAIVDMGAVLAAPGSVKPLPRKWKKTLVIASPKCAS